METLGVHATKIKTWIEKGEIPARDIALFVDMVVLSAIF
jgi:hypothetical protein